MKKCRLLIVAICLTSAFFSWSALAQNHNTSSNNPGANSNNAPTTTPSNTSALTPAQVKQVETIIRDYLIKNPEILVKASEALQQKQIAQAQKSAMIAIKTNVNEIFNDPKSPTVGNPNGSIDIVEFFDYQCGHCKTMSPLVIAAMKKNPNIKIIFKELPIFGGSSKFAAKAALASVAQGKYLAFHNALFAYASPLDPTSILNIAKKVGLNVNKIKIGMNNAWVGQQLRANFQLAEKLKLIGTPAFIISNQDHTQVRFIPGATSAQNFNQMIKAVSSPQ